MGLIIQKYGGTSVGTIDRIQAVAKRVLASVQEGHQVIVVVSAMAGETNRLAGLAQEIAPEPDSREYDVLLASGEQVTVGLLSLAINQHSQQKAHPILGYQLGLRTDGVHSKARIQRMDTELLKASLNRGEIPVVAGFQGINAENQITTLGRGGSDTSAVAIAAALQADSCEILTDVDGIYTTDPRLYSGARKIETISYEEMMEMASLGAKVLQIRSVELAAKYRVPLHVRSSFHQKEGTQVVPSDSAEMKVMMEEVVVSGVAADSNQAKITLQNLPEQPGVASEIFGALSDASIVVDVIVQNQSPGNLLSISFTVQQGDLHRSIETLEGIQSRLFPEMRWDTDQELAKVSIVGVGMQHHPGVASKMFRLLGDEGINICLITTSEIKVSCLIPSQKVQRAVEVLHRGFQLD